MEKYKSKILETLQNQEAPLEPIELALLCGAAKRVEVIDYDSEFQYKKELWDLLSAGEINLTSDRKFCIIKDKSPGTVEC